MFLVPIVIGYVGVHYWLMQHDPVLYYVSLYAQLGLILVSCPAAMVTEWIDYVVFGLVGWLIGLGLA
jgi:hypothetical protein